MVKPGRASHGFRMADFSLERLLGGLTPARFLAEYWQRRPLLVRQALPGFGDWLDRDGLAALAQRDDAESRLVCFRRGRCELEHGPFTPEQLSALPRRNWSLLVSGVNLLLDDGDRLLRRFDFLPRARLDDLMVSDAPPGGGIGPHFDSYDVFLIQGQGRRRWEISAQDDLTLVDGAPLRILQNFRVDDSWVLEPGDMLYLPPRLAHNGVALTDCMTWSVGFRAPKAGEIAGRFLDYLHDHLDLEGLYADPGMRQPAHAGEIPADLLDWTARTLRAVRWDKRDIGDFLGRYLSEPKPHVFFDPPQRALSLAAFARRAARAGVVLDARSQLLFHGRAFFINGECIEVAPAQARALRMLADQRTLPAEELAEDLLALLHDWYRHGYLKLGSA